MGTFDVVPRHKDVPGGLERHSALVTVTQTNMATETLAAWKRQANEMKAGLKQLQQETIKSFVRVWISVVKPCDRQ